MNHITTFIHPSLMVDIKEGVIVRVYLSGACGYVDVTYDFLGCLDNLNRLYGNLAAELWSARKEN